MRLKISKEMCDEYAQKLSSLYKDYNYAGTKDSIPAKLLNSSDYKKVAKELLKDMFSANVIENDNNTIMTNFSTNTGEEARSFDEEVALAMDFLIAIDMKRNEKTKLYKGITQVPTNDLGAYLEELKSVMVNAEMVKPKMTNKKWLTKWAKQLDKWDKKGINDLAKASTQKSGIAGFFEKKRNKRAVRKQNPSPVNALGLNTILNELVDNENLSQLTPQIFKSFANKVSKPSPKVNQSAEVANEVK